MLEKILTGSGLTAALAASTCCVLPLSLGALGIGSAWTSGFAMLTPYQTLFRGLAILLLGMAFWLVYGRPGKSDNGTACASVFSRRATKSALWLGALVLALVLSAGWWQRLVA